MASREDAVLRLLVALLDKAEDQCKGLYATMALIPFDMVRTIIDKEENGIKDGTMRARGVTPEDIKLIKAKYDMFETVYNELHAFALEMDNHKKSTVN